jgi:hypothetical protein
MKPVRSIGRKSLFRTGPQRAGGNNALRGPVLRNDDWRRLGLRGCSGDRRPHGAAAERPIARGCQGAVRHACRGAHPRGSSARCEVSAASWAGSDRPSELDEAIPGERSWYEVTTTPQAEAALAAAWQSAGTTVTPCRARVFRNDARAALDTRADAVLDLAVVFGLVVVTA